MKPTAKPTKNDKFLSFEEAREFVHKLNVKGKEKFQEYCKSGNKPINVPANPANVYKNTGWISWGDFLGTYSIATRNKIYLPFEEARDFVRKLYFKSEKYWRLYCKSGKKPFNIPNTPQIVYKNSGWISMGDWLGTGTISPQKKIFLPFNRAREFVRELKLKSQTEWFKYCKSGNKPINVPANPANVYKNTGWISWGDFLGTYNFRT